MAITASGGIAPTPPSPPCLPDGGAKEWVNKCLQDRKQLLTKLARKAALVRPSIIGNTMSWLLGLLGKFVV